MKPEYVGIAPALESGLEIIEFISAKERPVSFTELEKLGTSKSTLNRLLKVLHGKGYLQKGEGGYLPGCKCNLLGVRSNMLEQLREHGAALVREVAAVTGNTSILFYFNGSQTQVVAKDMSENSIVMQPVGNVSEDYVRTPWGWLLLASGQVDAEVLRSHAKIMSSTQYQQDIEFYHTNGFALDTANNILRFATPVLNGEKIVAILGLGGNILTISSDKVMEYGSLLVAAAKRLSGLLQ